MTAMEMSTQYNRWLVTLALLVLATVPSVDAARVSPSLRAAADHATVHNPRLRVTDDQRWERFLSSVRDMAVKPRLLEQDNDQADEENNRDGSDGYDGYGGQEEDGYKGDGDHILFSGTGFGSKWTTFLSSMKNWTSSVSARVAGNRTVDGSNETAVEEDGYGTSEYYANDAEQDRSGYGGGHQQSQYTPNYWNNDNDDYGSVIWENYQGMQNSDLGFGMTNYNFMYTGCSNVPSTAYDETRLERYATFLLCPASTCSNNTFRGCKYNYGEYVVKLDDFLMAMVEYNEERMTGFCEYCQECTDIQAFNTFVATVNAQKSVAISRAQSHYNEWYQSQYGGGYSYNSNYNTNAGQIKYYKMVSKNGKYSSNNYNSNSGGSSGSSSGASSNNNGSSSNGYGLTSDASVWQSMGQGAGSWYGHQIVNGFYDSYGKFYVSWGYLSGDDGTFISLEDTSISWDSTIYGEISQKWDEELLEDGAMVSSCKYKYTSECAAQYDSCMALVADNEDSENDENNQQQPSSTAPVSLKEHLECTPIDMDTFNSMSQKKQTYEQNAYGKYAQSNSCEEGDQECTGQYDQLYTGPHCGDNGVGVSLAVYTDEYCSNYASKYTVQEVLGVSVNEDAN